MLSGKSTPRFDYGLTLDGNIGRPWDGHVGRMGMSSVLVDAIGGSICIRCLCGLLRDGVVRTIA